MWTNKPPLNLQKQVLKNQEDIETLQTNGSAPQLDAVTNVSYNSTDGAIIDYDNGTTQHLPIIPGNGITIDAASDNAHVVVKQGDTINLADAQTLSVHSGEVDVDMIKITPTTIGLNSNGGDIWLKINNKSGLDYFSDKIELSGTLAVGDTGEIIDWVPTNAYYEISGVPTSSTSGTLPNDQSYFELKTYPERFRLLFNKEFYQLSDNQHTTGTLVYSHVGYENGQLIVKTITITISTRAWVLTTIKPATHLAIVSNELTSDSAYNNIIGKLICNMPVYYNMNVNTYIMAIGQISFLQCNGYITYNGVTEPIWGADSYDPGPHTITVYTPTHTYEDGGISCFIAEIAPDYIDLSEL